MAFEIDATRFKSKQSLASVLLKGYLVLKPSTAPAVCEPGIQQSSSVGSGKQSA
jgi:hypothetical protein